MIFNKKISLLITTVCISVQLAHAGNDNTENKSLLNADKLKSGSYFGPTLGALMTASQVGYRMTKNALSTKKALTFTAATASTFAASGLQKMPFLSLVLCYGGYHGYMLKNQLIKDQEENFKNTATQLEDLKETSKKMLDNLEIIQRQIVENNNILENSNKETPGLISQMETLKISLTDTLENLKEIEKKQEKLQKHISQIAENEIAHQENINLLNNSIKEQNDLLQLFQPQLNGFKQEIDKYHKELLNNSTKLETETAEAKNLVAALLLESEELENHHALTWQTANDELKSQSTILSELKNNKKELIQSLVSDYNLENEALKEAAEREFQNNQTWQYLYNAAKQREKEHKRFLTKFKQNAERKCAGIDEKILVCQEKLAKQIETIATNKRENPFKDPKKYSNLVISQAAHK